MIKVLLFDLARVLLFPKDTSYMDELNILHRNLSTQPNYDFDGYFYLDEKLMDYLGDIKDKFRLYMFTSGTIQNTPQINEKLTQIFNKIYSAAEMGVSKKDPESYIKIAKDIGIYPKEVLFIDDSEENAVAARAAGMEAIVFMDLQSLKTKLSSLR